MTTTLKEKTLQEILGRVNLPAHRPPMHPGRFILEDFLKPLGVSQKQLAKAIQLPYQQVNEIINERRPVTPAIALRLSMYLGMSATYWTHAQLRWDLYHALQADAEILNAIEPLPRPDMPELMKLAGLEENNTP